MSDRLPAQRSVDMVAVVRFLPDVAKLFWAAVRDPRVPWYAKASTGAAVAYVVSPLDVIPDVIPVIGRLDDVWLVVKALRFLFREAGYEVLSELWSGTPEGFDVLLVAAGIRD
ncbi:MAG: uncharacterized membrane protein YkvA (DUF1232 family) [Glaciecola sp.]|jgi:uncharacterized membrane protein YkvA (DUF1232 family)